MKSFKDFLVIKEEVSKDWKKGHVQLEKGFIPPQKMRPIIRAFLDSGDIEVMKDTTKEMTMPKKSLYLTGGAVRDFVKGKSIRDYHLVTNATPEQIALILHKYGFKMCQENENKNMKLVFAPKIAGPNEPKTWCAKDTDKKGKPYSITATVRGEEFTIETFRKGPKTSRYDGDIEFADNPMEDAEGRDLTINAMYLELSKDDGENNKLYDPSGKGYHDTNNQVVRTNGKAKDRFEEDPIRILRTIRYHCRFGKTSKMDEDIEKEIPNYADLEDVDLEEVRDEFMKGLLHPDTNLKCYVKIWDRTGLMKKLLPGVTINTDIPPAFSSKRDQVLALAWLLHDNDTEVVSKAFANQQGKKGWNNQEKSAVMFLLSLLQFHPEQRSEYMKLRKGTGLSKGQIKDWVDMFNITDKLGRVRNSKPQWAIHVKTFADYDEPMAHPKELEGLDLPNASLAKILGQLENEKFMGILPKTEYR